MVNRCLERDPGQRFPTVEQLAQALGQAFDEELNLDQISPTNRSSRRAQAPSPSASPGGDWHSTIATQPWGSPGAEGDPPPAEGDAASPTIPRTAVTKRFRGAGSGDAGSRGDNSTKVDPRQRAEVLAHRGGNPGSSGALPEGGALQTPIGHGPPGGLGSRRVSWIISAALGLLAVATISFFALGPVSEPEVTVAPSPPRMHPPPESPVATQAQPGDRKIDSGRRSFAARRDLGRAPSPAPDGRAADRRIPDYRALRSRARSTPERPTRGHRNRKETPAPVPRKPGNRAPVPRKPGNRAPVPRKPDNRADAQRSALLAKTTGEIFLEQQRFSEALKSFRRAQQLNSALRIDLELGDLYRLRGRSRRGEARLADYRQAVTHYRRVIQQEKGPRSARAARRLRSLQQQLKE